MTTGAIFTDLLQGLFFVLAGIFFIWLVKRVDDWRTRDFDDDVHIDDGNMAIGFRRAGLYTGMALGLSGALDGPSSGFFSDLFHLIVDGFLIIGLMFISRFINDYVMMGHVNNDAECVREFTDDTGRKTVGNTAIGLVEASMFIATGFILKGSLSGGGGSFFQSLLSALLFFILGQAVLLVFGFLYELVTPYNVRTEVKQNNLAAGVSLGGLLVSLGIILMSSVSGPFTGWASDIKGFLIYTGYGMAALLVFRMLIDRLLLPTTDLATEVKQDRNVAALMVVESTLIAVALLIAYSA